MNLGFDLDEWNKVVPIEAGEFESLALGGHEVIIVDARLYTSDISNNTSLKVSIDIAGNDEQAGYFKRQFEENTLPDKKWSNSATKYLSLKKENLAYTKGFITSLEKSNNGFKFDMNKGWEQLKNLKCAGVFGLEEYTKQDGTIGTTIRLTQFRSIDKLNDIKIPRVKLINGTFIEYEKYDKNNNNKIEETFGNAVEIEDSFLD